MFVICWLCSMMYVGCICCCRGCWLYRRMDGFGLLIVWYGVCLGCFGVVCCCC